MTEFCRGRSQDQEEIIDFINMVFSQNSVPHDFKILLPKLYGDDADTGCCHFLAKEDGKIRAVVGLFLTQLHVGEQRLKLGHIGSVSVHKYSRGKGYMKKLMHMAIEAAKAEKMDALVLGGLKNRYQYFGFQPTGIRLKYEFIPENVTHQYRGEGSEDIVFAEVTSSADPLFAAVRSLYEQRPVYMDRGSDDYFYRVLCSWGNRVYAVLKRGKFAGYMLSSANHRYVGEWGLFEKTDFPAVLAAWFAAFGESQLVVICPPYDKESSEILGRYSEAFVPATGANWRILNFENVAEAFMRLKNEYDPLEAGSLGISVKTDNESIEFYRLTSDGKSIHVRREALELPCERKLELDLLDAQEALFSEAVYWRNYDIPGGAAYKNWFPLPLYVDDADTC